jgi:hypothetical protein
MLHEDFINAHKKNVDTMQSMTVLTSDMMQSIAQMNAQYFYNILDDMHDLLKTQSPLEAGQKMQHFVSKASGHSMKVFDKTRQMGNDVKDLMSKNIQESANYYKKN